MKLSRILLATFLVASTLSPLFLPESKAATTANAKKSEKDATTPQEIFDQMRDSFRADKAKGQHIRFQFNFTGPNGGHWWIVVNDGTYKMDKGAIDHPDVTFSASDADWVRICNDQLSGTWAFLSGRLRVSGSQSTARKLGEIFP